MINEKKKDEYFFVAEEEGKIVAGMELLIKKNDSFFKHRKYGYLDSVTVHQKYRKKGVARMMANFAFEFFKKKRIKYIVSKVFINNKVARNAWKKTGFEERSVNLFKVLK